MILESVTPFRSRDLAFKLATEAWELRAYHRLRVRIFSDEQKLFVKDDRDDVDDCAVPIVALTRVAGMPDEVVGVVRIWEESQGTWWGGRLGTHPDHRRNGIIGPGLVNLAVRTACQRGCGRFLANVQSQNVKLFERLHWSVIRPMELCGQAHALMTADLTCYGGTSP